MVKRYELGFATYEIHSNYIIGEVAEGVNYGIEEISQIQELIKNTFPGYFGYISNRLHDYSVDPKMWSFSFQIPGLSVYAIVVDDRKPPELLELELSFFEYFELPEDFQLKVFTELDKAITWTKTTLASLESASEESENKQDHT